MKKEKVTTIKKYISEQLELPEVGLMKLPPKWKVLENSSVGYDFYDENNELTLQQPKDNDTTRKYCWAIYNKVDKNKQ